MFLSQNTDPTNLDFKAVFIYCIYSLFAVEWHSIYCVRKNKICFFSIPQHLAKQSYIECGIRIISALKVQIKVGLIASPAHISTL